MKLIPWSVVVMLAAMVGVRAAAADAKPSDNADSPKQALMAQDAAARAGKVDEDLSFYLSEGDDQKKLAQSFAEGDVELARLRKAVEEKFGKDLAAAVVHAAGTEDATDVEAASVKTDGDEAVIEWKDRSAEPLHMTRSDGKWKVSLPAMFKGVDAATLQKIDGAMRELTAELRKLADLVAHDKFRSGRGVRDRVQDLHDRLFGSPAKT